GLKGDPSDNIPGVAGVGEKTAIKLISEFGSLESLYEEIKKETQKAKGIKPKLRETLVQSKEQAFLSKMLVTIKQDVPIDFNLKKCQWKDYDRNKVIKIFVNLSFKSLISRLPGAEIEKQMKSGVPKIGDNLTIW
ncbi:DNA polymerase I, partial [Patescibacteria group bacterium]|nr:DNA polymerase I [Patescibacteria group bacterium]